MRPLRFVNAPGPSLLAGNVGDIEVCEEPGRREIERLEHCPSQSVYALFDLDGLARAIVSTRRLRLAGHHVLAARGRVVSAETAEAFTQLWLRPRFADLVLATNRPRPERWLHPVVFADTWRAGGATERLGVVFGRLPEAGLLDIEDIGRAGVREGAAESALRVRGGATSAADVPALLQDVRRGGSDRVLLVDNGGPVSALADALASAGGLGAYFGPARRPPPRAVLAHGRPVYTWFEPEDWKRRTLPTIPTSCRACAFVPIGLPGETIGGARDRLQELRRHGYAAVVPRFHLPVPATREWDDMTTRFPIRQQVGEPLDGSYPIFAVPGWELPAAMNCCAEVARPNQWPQAGLAAVDGRRRYSLPAVEGVLRGYTTEVRSSSPDCHARDLLQLVLREVGTGRLGEDAEYPYVAWQGENLVQIVDRAIEARLCSIDDTPQPLAVALRHTALAGGKRIRPVLSLAMGLSMGAPIDAILPASLAVEWLHTASLVQDDLPSMDDEPIRRRRVAAHVRHGEGLALLASDALVAMTFADLASLAEHPRVGAERSNRLVASVAHALGPHGLVGGQARDLLAMEREIDVSELVEIHRRKTAPLFRLTATISATLADLAPQRQERLETLLGDLGVAFQIVDDVLDAEADGQSGDRLMGDLRRRRATFATLMRQETALGFARSLVLPLVEYAGRDSALGLLSRLATFVVTRKA